MIETFSNSQRVETPKALLLAAGLVISFLILFPAAAAAIDVHVNQDAVAADGLIPDIQDGQTIDVSTSPGYSYCCFMSIDGISPRVEFSAVQELFGVDVAFARRGYDAPPVNRAGSFNGGRACFISPDGNTNATIQLTVDIDPNISPPQSSANNVRVRCDETTLFGGFNTLTGEINFLELQNTLSRHITAPDISGFIEIGDNISGEWKKIPFIAPNGGRVDIALHEVFEAAAFGPVIISHNGPPGSLKAVVRFYKVSSETPSGLEPVSKDSFAPR